MCRPTFSRAIRTPTASATAGVWHFYTEPDSGGGAETVLPAGSLLAKWQSSTNADEKRQLAERDPAVVARRRGGTREGLAQCGASSGAHVAQRPAAQFNLRSSQGGEALIPSAFRVPRSEFPVASAATSWGLDPALFGKHPNGASVDANSLCVHAPSVIEVRLPADLAAGCEFVTTGALHRETGAEGSVQMQVLTTKPTAAPGLAAGASKEQGGKSTWSDGERPVVSDSPIFVTDGSAARKRIEAAFEEFRQLFPAALCYTKIVPVDEVVTLTLFYREDDHLAPADARRRTSRRSSTDSGTSCTTSARTRSRSSMPSSSSGSTPRRTPTRACSSRCASRSSTRRRVPQAAHRHGAAAPRRRARICGPRLPAAAHAMARRRNCARFIRSCANRNCRTTTRSA